MKKIRIILAALLACFALSGVFAFGEGESGGTPTIVFATDSTWPPFEFVNENKELVGFTIDMVQAIAKEEGFVAKFITVGWDGIFIGLQNRDYDAIASSVTITEERKKGVDFSAPYFNAGQTLLVHKSDAARIKSLGDLAGKTVGAQIGTSGAFLVEKDKRLKLKTYDDIGLAIAALANKGVDGVVADAPLIRNYALQNERYKGLFTVIGGPMTTEEYGLVVRKGNSELLQALNRGLAKIRANGTYDKLIDKWIK